MFERFTEQARRAIFFARFEAGHQLLENITVAHILIGLTRDTGSRADAVGSLRERATELRKALGISLPVKTAKDPALERQIPLDDNSKMALAYAVQEASTDDSFYIDTDHLLRGILRFPNEAAAALEAFSLDLAAARAASKLHRAKFPPEGTVYQRLFGGPFRAHQIRLVKLLAFVIVCFLAVLVIRLLN